MTHTNRKEATLIAKEKERQLSLSPQSHLLQEVPKEGQHSFQRCLECDPLELAELQC